MTILNSLVSFYNSYPVGSTYHEVAAHLLKNLDKIENCSIEELANLCYTSPATINRFVRMIDCTSFKEFKRSIAETIDNYPLYNRCYPMQTTEEPTPEAFLNCFRELLDQMEHLGRNTDIDRICETINDHSSIRLYMDFASSHAKRQFQIDLAVTGKDTAFLSKYEDWIRDVAHCNEETLLFMSTLNNPMFSKQIEVMQLAKNKGATVMVICRRGTPNVSKFADVMIEFDGNGTAMTQYIIDIFINIVTIRYRYKYID